MSSYTGVLIASTLCAALGQVLFKVGSHRAETLLHFLNAWILTGLFAYGIGTLLWIYALSRMPLTVAYPFTALTFALVYLAGVFLFGEPMTMRALGGVILILCGLFLIAVP